MGRAPRQVIGRNLGGLILALVLVLVAGCGREPIGFPYADEQYTYPSAPLDMARIHLGEIRDLRPLEQRRGQGRFIGITYPSDTSWELPVTSMYREALTRDLSQTRLAHLVPLPSQADYVLEVEIESFHVRMTRGPFSFMVPPAVALIGGFVLGDDVGSALKRAAVLSVITYGALPMPAEQRAEVVVHLLLRDGQGQVIWDQTCLGEVEDKVGEAVTSRRDKIYAERYLPQAVKRANACLLGQLRQFLVAN